jgi:hypothetical protein
MPGHVVQPRRLVGSFRAGCEPVLMGECEGLGAVNLICLHHARQSGDRPNPPHARDADTPPLG